MIGNNSCGVHSVMAGKTDNIEELDVLTSDGLRMKAGAASEDELNKIRVCPSLPPCARALAIQLIQPALYQLWA